MFCRDIPTISATSVSPTRSGATSINLAEGTACRTSASALRTAPPASVASRVNASPRRSTSTFASRSSSPSWYFRVKVYSILLLLCAAFSLALLAIRHTVVHDAPQGACVVAWVLRRAPYAGDTELAAATLLVVVRTINPSPSMAAADFDAPALPFGVPESFFNLFLRMGGTSHQRSPVWG